MNNLSTAQLAGYLLVTKRTIQRRANKERWAHIEQTGLGGQRRVYAFDSLPSTVKTQVVAQIIAKHEQLGANYQQGTPNKPHGAGTFDLLSSPFITVDHQSTGDWLSQHSFAHPLDNTEIDKEYIKVGLLVLARLYVLSFSLGKIRGFDQFCQKYNSHEFAIDNAIYFIIPRVSRITLLRWEKRCQALGAAYQLIDTTQVPLDKDLQQMGKELLMVTPDISARRLRQYFLTIFTNRKIPSERTVSLWLKRQRESILQVS